MKTSPTEPRLLPRAEAGLTRLVFAGADAAAGRWLVLEDGAVAARGEADDALPLLPGARTVLAVPGSEVAIHWLDLASGLAPAQAAAAARLILADASAEPLADMHVAVGRAERGLTPVALVPAARMLGWLSTGLDPELIVPEPLLILPPPEGLARRDAGPVPDYRGLGAAFSVEPALAALLAGEGAIEPIGKDAFEAGLGAALAPPVLNLRQGVFVRRRQWRLERTRVRRALLLAGALAAVTLIVLVATIMRYTFDADRLEAEATAIRGPAASELRPTFGTVAAALFDAVRATPNIEVSRLDYRPDGSLGATVLADSPATLAAFRQRAEAGGLAVDGGTPRTEAGRPVADLVLRPA